MDKTYTKADMQPIVDFLSKGMKLIKEENYKNNLNKIVGNFDVALAAAHNDAEKHAYLYALYANNAAALASYLFLNDLITPELTAEFRTLPNAAAAEAAIAPYKEAVEAKRDEITAMQKEFMEHNKGLEVFKGVALGDSLEDAQAGVEAYEKKVADAMGGQH